MTDRCYGHCCRRFTIPFSPRELQAAFVENQKRERGEASDDSIRVLVDVEIIAPMVIYLGACSWNPANGKPAGQNLHHYTRKHHDRATGDCRIYDKRPEMCREYPYAVSCAYPGCASVEARAGRMGSRGPMTNLPILQPGEQLTEATP